MMDAMSTVSTTTHRGCTSSRRTPIEREFAVCGLASLRHIYYIDDAKFGPLALWSMSVIAKQRVLSRRLAVARCLRTCESVPALAVRLTY